MSGCTSAEVSRHRCSMVCHLMDTPRNVNKRQGNIWKHTIKKKVILLFAAVLRSAIQSAPALDCSSQFAPHLRLQLSRLLLHIVQALLLRFQVVNSANEPSMLLSGLFQNLMQSLCHGRCQTVAPLHAPDWLTRDNWKAEEPKMLLLPEHVSM